MPNVDIPTTITSFCEYHKACYLEQDVVARIDYRIRDGEIDWNVDEFCVHGTREVFVRQEGGSGVLKREPILSAVPHEIAQVYEIYLDRKHVEEKLYEHAYASGELAYHGAQMRAEYHAGVM